MEIKDLVVLRTGTFNGNTLEVVELAAIDLKRQGLIVDLQLGLWWLEQYASRYQLGEGRGMVYPYDKREVFGVYNRHDIEHLNHLVIDVQKLEAVKIKGVIENR